MAHGFFIQYPTSKRTDPGYAVAPEILSLVDEARQAQGKEAINLGLLVNSYQLHEKHFLYQIYKSFPQVRLRELARNWNETPAYNQLFEMDYVLVSDRHTFRTSEASQLAVARILQNPADMFNQAFTPVRQWTLPSGERLTLYARRFAPVEPGVATDDMLALLTYFGDQLGPGDAVVLTSPDLVYLLGLALPAEAGGAIVPLPLPNTAPAATIAVLEELARTHQRLFLVRHNAEKADPAGVIERWLHDHTITGGDAWAKAVQVTPFVPVEPVATRLLASGVNWPDGATLQSAVQVYPAGLGPSPVAGGALVAELEWAGDVTGRKASLQLLAPDGRLVAQDDRETAPGRQTAVLLVPRSAAPGDYRLILTLYDPVTLQRFALADGAEATTLGAITVAPNTAQTVHVNPDLLAPPDQGEDDGT